MSDETDADLPPRIVDLQTSHPPRAPRQRTLQAAKVTYHDGAISLDCSVRDLSETGARISLPAGQVIPTNVVLIYPRTQTVYEAQVTWIKAPQFGLKFFGKYSMTEDLPKHLKYLKFAPVRT